MLLPWTFVASWTLSLAFRPPCIPLDVATPYQSTWSCAWNGIQWSNRYEKVCAETGESLLHAFSCFVWNLEIPGPAPWLGIQKSPQVMTTWQMDLLSIGQAELALLVERTEQKWYIQVYIELYRTSLEFVFFGEVLSFWIVVFVAALNDMDMDKQSPAVPGDSLDWVGLVRIGTTVYRWLGQPLLDCEWLVSINSQAQALKEFPVKADVRYHIL